MEKKVFFDGEFGKVCGVLHKVDSISEIAIIVHGFSSTKDTAAVPISKKLNQIGVNALRIDLDNQGESKLDFQTGACIPNYVKQVESAINYCKDLGYKKISLVGGSYGGLVVFATALVHPEIQRMVLRVPVVDYKEHALWLYGADKLNQFKKKGYMPYYDKHNEKLEVTFDFIEKSYPYSMYENARNVKIPTLIIQGDKDEQVDYRAAKKAVKFFPNAKLHIINGASHDLAVDGDFSEGLNILIDFFKK